MEQQNFFDSRTVIAILLVGVVWIGWQSHLSKKYPDAFKKPQEQAQVKDQTPAETPPTPAKETSQAVASATEKVPEKEILFEDSTWKFTISSQGMGIKNLTLKNFSDRSNSPIAIGAGALPFATFLESQAVAFKISQLSETEFVGEANYQGAKIKKVLRVESSKFLITSEIKVDGQPKDFSLVVAEDSMEGAAKDAPGKQMGGDPAQWQSYFISHATKTDYQTTTASQPLKEKYDQVSVASLSGKYFGQALVDDSPIVPTFRTDFDENSKRYLGWLTYDFTGQKTADLKVKFYAGPKSLDLLRVADPRLEKTVNYGMFGWLAGPLLTLMKWLYGLTLNYGAAIILMTLLVRIAVMPFNIASYRSMKAMQVIQPQVNKLKEKFKDDPQAMNREMMKLMKDNNANPLMGCLPMLLQLPVFFALYQVLDQSIELYKAPFIFWVHDLSLKDPYFVLPLLMGITMFIQQKITPTAMDPTQAKVLLMMPIVFTFMMVSLPSGLTLYIFISTLFGIIQQFMFMRDRKTSPKTTAIQAKA